MQRRHTGQIRLPMLPPLVKTSNLSAMKPMILIGLFFTALLSSCDKKNEDSIPKTSSFTVKYEVTCSASVVPSTNGYLVGYTNEIGQSQVEYIKSGSSWLKELTVTATQRPLQMIFELGGTVLSAPGTIVIKMYINNQLKASSTGSTSVAGGIVAIPILQYVIQ